MKLFRFALAGMLLVNSNGAFANDDDITASAEPCLETEYTIFTPTEYDSYEALTHEIHCKLDELCGPSESSHYEDLLINQKDKLTITTPSECYYSTNNLKSLMEHRFRIYLTYFQVKFRCYTKAYNINGEFQGIKNRFQLIMNDFKTKTQSGTPENEDVYKFKLEARTFYEAMMSLFQKVKNVEDDCLNLED